MSLPRILINPVGSSPPVPCQEHFRHISLLRFMLISRPTDSIAFRDSPLSVEVPGSNRGVDVIACRRLACGGNEKVVPRDKDPACIASRVSAPFEHVASREHAGGGNVERRLLRGV